MARLFEVARTWHQNRRPVEEWTLAAWERRRGRRLPSDYRQFLLATDGGVLRPSSFELSHPRISGARHELERLFDWRELRLRSQESLEASARNLPPQHLAIGLASDDLLILLSLADPGFGAVAAWPRDSLHPWGQEPNTLVIPLAPRFSDFLDRLAAPPDSPSDSPSPGESEVPDARRMTLGEPRPPRQEAASLETEAGFVGWYVDELAPSAMPALDGSFDRRALHVMVARGRLIAMEHGFTDPQSQFHFLAFMWRAGVDFFRRPGVREIVRHRALPGPDRIDQLYLVDMDRVRADDDPGPVPASIATGALDPYVAVRGTGVLLPMPTRFAVAPRSAGIRWIEAYASVQAVQLPAPINEISASSEAAFAQRGLRRLRSEPVASSIGPATLFEVAHGVDEVELRKWMLVAGDAGGSVVLTATAPADGADALDAVFRHVLLGARWLPERSGETRDRVDLSRQETGSKVQGERDTASRRQALTKEEVLSRCVWHEHDSAALAVFSRMFDETVEVELAPAFDSGRQISDPMVAALNDFLALSESDLPTVKDLLWQDCQHAFDVTSYGFDVLDGESEKEANHREFKIHTREDAYVESHLRRVSIPDRRDLRNNYAAIDFEPAWDREHGCSIVMKNGKLVGRYSNDVPFGRFEEDGA